MEDPGPVHGREAGIDQGGDTHGCEYEDPAQELHQQLVAKQNKNDTSGLEILQKELDNILIKIERENEDNFSLSKGLDNYVKVTVDVKSLGVLNTPT